MRSPPAPTAPSLRNLIVSRPATASSAPSGYPGSTALVRRDDLLAATVLAAGSHPTPLPHARGAPRSVLANMQRKCARFASGFRRRRRREERENVARAVGMLRAGAEEGVQGGGGGEEEEETLGEVKGERTVRIGKVVKEDIERTDEQGEENREEEEVVRSLTAGEGRRVRQFGAKDDDDTLLMLPRVGSVSFEERERRETGPRKRYLPRVGALMPVRMKGVSQENEKDDEDEDEDDEEEEEEVERRGLCRLPTGMTDMDVEREMERVVVEISSDGDSDGVLEIEEEEEVVDIPKFKRGLSGEGTAGGFPVSNLKERERSYPRERKVEGGGIPAWAGRRISSTNGIGGATNGLYWKRRVLSEEEGRGHGRGKEWKGDGIKGKRDGGDCSLFEDDYLSFQGFDGGASRLQYQSMSALLLRSRVISSLTDSHSEEDDCEEACESAVKSLGTTEWRKRPTVAVRRNFMLSNMFRKTVAPVA